MTKCNIKSLILDQLHHTGHKRTLHSIKIQNTSQHPKIIFIMVIINVVVLKVHATIRRKKRKILFMRQLMLFFIWRHVPYSL